MTLLYRTLLHTAAPALRAVYRPAVTGREFLPHGPAIFASNHLSASDQVFIAAAARVQILYFAKSNAIECTHDISACPACSTSPKRSLRALRAILDRGSAGH